jgi:SAM-dependent methyltransferase
MPIRLTLLENILAHLNLLPVPLFDMPLAPGVAKMLITACELNVFDTLSKRRLSLETLATMLACQPQGLQLLLQVLVAAGYLRYQRGMYANTPMAQRWLTSASSRNIAPYIIHSQDIVAIWDHVTEVIHTNKQAMHMPYAEDACNPETQQFLARHYAGLASLATALGGEIAQRVRMPDKAERLLDVGGSHAGYSVLFCRKYPHLHATIMDIQPGIDAGKRIVKQTKLSERIDFVCNDIIKDNFPVQFSQPFDVALYFHIAHLLPAELNIMLLEKVAQTLRPGGLLIFVDQVVDQTHGSRLASLIVQFMALTMTTVGGTCYTFPTIKGWLERVGMGQIQSYRLLTPGASLITAIKR